MAWNWRPMINILLIALTFHSTTLHNHAAKIHDDPNYSFLHNATEAPVEKNSKYYDYIIIGGGTAGCPLAATLSQNFSVLLLERGGSPYLDEFVQNLVGFYPNLLIDTPTSASQSFTSEDGIPNQRARVLGGGSAINAGFFTYADPDFITESRWDATLVNESYVWVADVVAQFPTLQTFQTAAKDALLEVGIIPFNNKTYEHLSGTKIGGSLFDKSGQRHTAADLFIYANPDNLDVYIWANVQQLLFDSVNGPNGLLQPKATGVVFIDLNGVNHTVLLNDNHKSEVILSAGALGSPQMLLLSGIGPQEHLATFNITTAVDNPMVGARMSDNPTNYIWVMTNQEVEVSLIQAVGITSFGSYIEVTSGQAEVLLGAPESTLENLHQMLDNLNSNSSFAQFYQARIFKAILSVPPPFQSQAFWSGVMLQKIWGPQSWGLLRLVSLSASDNPSVRFNYFQEPEDLATCEQGVRTLMDTVNATSLRSLQYTNDSIPEELRPVKDAVESTYPPRDLGNSTQDAMNIRQWCLDTVSTIWHYHGGCLVGEVVDEEYRVTGVQALRVIDGSTFRRSPGTNPQATVMMLGRYMGVQILRSRLSLEGV